MIKFKYLSTSHGTVESLEKMYNICEAPLPYNNLPNGIYLIRGDKKFHRKRYYKINDTWFLIENRTTDKGQYNSDSYTYELFPSLPQKEWDMIRNAGYSRLNNVWRRHLAGYKLWNELRKSKMELRLVMLKYDNVKL